MLEQEKPDAMQTVEEPSQQDSGEADDTTWRVKVWNGLLAGGRALRLHRVGAAIRVLPQVLRSWLSQIKEDRSSGWSLFGDIRLAFAHLRFKRLFWGIVGFLLLLYFFSGVYQVDPGEEAVIRRFGQYTGEPIPEGIHYSLPWPIDRVTKVNVREIRRHSIGVPFEPHPISICPPDTAETLTGDENIVDTKLLVHYRVKDPAAYLFNLRYEDPHISTHRMIKDTARAAIAQLLGAMSLDEALTTAKPLLQRQIQYEVQVLLDRYQTGLQIVNINLEESSPVPPSEVLNAFTDVQNAKEEKEEKIHGAESYYNTAIPDAQGQAARLVADARGYQAKVVNEAMGEGQRFLSMLSEYHANTNAYSKEVTDYRLHIETMEKVLARVKKKYFLDRPKGGEQKVNLRFFDEQ